MTRPVVPDDAQRPRILVVDDDEGLLVLIADVLRAEGYDVSTVGSGAAALAWLAVRAADLMLLDLKLRDVAGPALLKRLKREDAPVPFVVVTGQGDEKVAVEMMKQGALDYVMKDSALLDLLPGVVRRALTLVERDRALAGAQAELRDSEARFAAAVRATDDGVWEVNVADRKAYFSARWKAILGYEPQEISDDFAEWERRVHSEDWPRFARAYTDLLEGHTETFHLEHRVRHKDRTYRWILARALLVRDAAGRPLRMTGANTDITARKELEREVLSISEYEQRKIGQELHDGLGQQLTAIELMCQALKSDLEAAQPDLAGQTSRVCEYLREAIAQARSLAHGLTPFMLDANGLQTALAALAQRTDQFGRVKCSFVCPASIPLDDSATVLHLYRIAQEAVTNALKHAGAGEIVIHLSSETDGTVRLTIADNGRGLPDRRAAAEGIGLRVMRHRADAIGAELTVESKRGEGVIVVCILRRKYERTG